MPPLSLCAAVALCALCGSLSAAALTVHVVPHTHDDVGWLKTVDEYYSGTNNTIQHAAVRNILNAVTSSLRQNPDRKFTYVEQAFFQRWWRELSPDEQNATRKLVADNQLNFVNGGWCMHDEAATHYVDMVDQTTLGHRLLKEAFGDDGLVTIGWQLDPFGHSATQAALLSAEAGFDGLFFGRIDYQDLSVRHAEKRNEFVWRASPSLGDDAQVFAGLSGEYGGNYGPPSGFNWNGNDEPVESNKNLQTYNVPARVDAAIKQALIQANMTRGEHIMWTMGSDFNYENAETWFINMDRLIDAVNADGRIQMKYSSPADYVAAKRAEKDVTWPVTTGDFFPYADGPHQFWSGYFTSRPALKGYVRTTSALFGVVRAAQTVAVAKANSKNAATSASASPASLETLEEALGVAQHHDAVSGTSKQHVAFDYARRLARGEDEAAGVFSDVLTSLRGGPQTDGAVYARCHRLNETVCAITQSMSSGSLELVLWNMLGHARNETVTFPVANTPGIVVTDSSGQKVTSQTYAAAETVQNYARNTKESLRAVSFKAELPPLGYTTYTVRFLPPPSASTSTDAIATTNGRVLTTAPTVLENDFVAVQFSANGLLSSMTNKATGTTIDMAQSFCYYVSGTGDRYSGQKSGAYIFRPKSDVCYPIANENQGADIELVIQGDVVSEVRQRFSPWLTQTVRLAADARHVDLEYTVGAVAFKSTTINSTIQRCVSWRQTGACDPNGPREPSRDLPCDQPVPGTASGFCECFGGRRAEMSRCGHPSFTCKQACQYTEGREVVSRLNTSIASAGVLLTDSNGREMLSRKRDFRPTWNFTNTERVAGNYYPINSAVAITDSKEAQLTVLVDRACGAGSISDGELEVMIHRRVLEDDSRGVGEPLNETRDTGSYAGQHGGQHSGPGLVVRGTHRLVLDKPELAARSWRPLADRTYSTAQLLFNQGRGGRASEESFVLSPLPPNVQIMTLQALSSESVLLRLSHQFGIGEDAEMSKPVTLDLATLLAPETFQIVKIQEVSLTNVRDKDEVLAARARNSAWPVEHGNEVVSHQWRREGEGAAVKSSNSSVTLGPLEIKTFVLTLASA